MLEEVLYPCKIDGSMQPAMVHFSESGEPRPLLVALHTWSYGYDADCSHYLKCCEERDWHLIHPHFRGPNWNWAGCGSDAVVSDLEDAVTYMKLITNVDSRRIYLVGGSGGGHCSLLLAGRRPDLWTAVSSWCPISDIGAWYSQCLGHPRFGGYAQHIFKACGDVANDERARFEAQLRSPLSWLQNAMELPVDINTGIHDGHTGSVPVSHTINAYNMLALPDDRVSPEDIESIVATETIPEWHRTNLTDAAYGTYKVLMRKQSRNVRMSLFEGGHNILASTACDWLARQVRGEKPDWGAGKAEADKNGVELSK